jgi:hypothetical protein
MRMSIKCTFHHFKEHEKKPLSQKAFTGSTHCATGCTLGDVAAEWWIFLGSLSIFGLTLFASYNIDYIFAYTLGIIFQYFSIVPMRKTHEHSVRDFRSNNVIIAGGDMVITGVGDIYENAVLEYRQVPITVHLMGKEHVLGLIIDTVKTNRHFVSNHEMFGTLIKGTGLEKIEKTLISSPQQQKDKKGMNMNGMAM